MEIKLVGFLADWCPAAAAFLPSDCCRLAGRAAHAVSWLALSVSSGLECYFHPKPAVYLLQWLETSLGKCWFCST